MTSHEYRNGQNSDAESDADEEILHELNEEGWAERLLRSLNAMRKSRQNFDVILSGEDGGEVPAHRAVLAGAAPHLLNILPCSDLAKVPVSGAALITLVEFMYTGRVKVPRAKETLGLYKAAAHLRVEPVRSYCAQLLVKSLTPQDCLMVRDLPDLNAQEKDVIDKYIADNFNSICECGAISSLPELRVEVVGTGNSEAEAGAEAEAVLEWCRNAVESGDFTIENAAKRTHLLYVSEGALRDCGSLPATAGDAPELGEYRRRRAVSPRRARRPALGRPVSAWKVLKASTRHNHTTTAIIDAQGRLLMLRLLRSPLAAGNTSDATLPHLGGSISSMSRGRCAHGASVLPAGQIVVCGGYDRSEVLRSLETYEPTTNVWTAGKDMNGPRARFSAAVLHDHVIAVGGSDGHHELDTVEAYNPVTNKWSYRAKLPEAVQHAGTASSGTQLYLVGGWTNGNCLKSVYRYTWDDDKWSEAPSLLQGRSQTAAVWWSNRLWAVGGCDSWHCLASTELWDCTDGAPTWTQGPALPTARRSVGAAVWRGALVAVGGSDGAASLRGVSVLRGGGAGAGWAPGPELRRCRAAPALLAAGNALVAVGGYSGQEFLSCAECLHEFDGQWTSLLDPPKPQKSIAQNGTNPEQNGTDIEHNGTNGTKTQENGKDNAESLKAMLKSCEIDDDNKIIS